MVASKVGEGLGKVGDEVVLHHGLDNYVVDIGFDVVTDLRLQALLDGLLVGRSSILEAEHHGHVAVNVVVAL
jgi:hypothetical protein